MGKPTENSTLQQTTTKAEISDASQELANLLANDAEAKEFMEYTIMSGKTIAPMNEYAIKQWLADFGQWKAAGKPKPKMPKIQKGEVDVPIAVYLLKDKGQNKMYVKCTNEKVIGREDHPIYEKEINPETGDEIDTNRVIRTLHKYTKPWSKDWATQVIKDAEGLNGPESEPQFYFMINGAKRGVNPEDILDFDKTYEKLRTGKYSK